MADLEKLVPPLELCQQIPIGSFDDSAFWYIWSEVDQKYILCSRGIGGVCVSANPCPCGMRYNYPAPTLKELMEALGQALCVKWSHPVRGMHWLVKRSDFDDGLIDDRPEAAALRLWLNLEEAGKDGDV